MNTIDFETSENLKQIVKAKGLKVGFVAEKCGYSLNMFSSLMNGRKRISPLDVVKICEGLGITPNELFSFVREYPKEVGRTRNKKASNEV